MLAKTLADTAARLPDQTSLIYGAERMSFADLAQRVERLAGGLRATGVQSGDRVALLLPNDPTFVIAFYALAALGAVAVPLKPILPGSRDPVLSARRRGKVGHLRQA